MTTSMLFAALIVTGFHGLLCLGELTFPNSSYLRDWRKVIKRSSLINISTSSSYPLTKQIVCLKATEFLFVLFHLLLLTHVQFSFVSFLLVITCFLLLLLCGSL